MKKCIYILFLLLVGITTTKAQVLHTGVFGSSGWDEAFDITSTSDSNYLVLGRTSFTNVYIAKIDTAMQLIWQKNYAGYYNWKLNTICEASDGSIIIGGATPNKNKAFLFKLNTQGDSLTSLTDSISYGNSISRLIPLSDGSLLAISHDKVGNHSLLKLDNNLNIINRIDTITKYRGVQVAANNMYVLRQDSVNNLLIINNLFSQIDTIIIPLDEPFYIRNNYVKDNLVFWGHNIPEGIKRMVFTNFFGGVENNCDSSFYFPKVDFKSINPSNYWLFLGHNNDTQWGQDIRLYFTDSCGKIEHDTILYRWSLSYPGLDERGIKLLVNPQGNYVILSEGEESTLGSWDIVVFTYKKWEQPQDTSGAAPEEELLEKQEVTIYPNPANSMLSIEGILPYQQLTVVDVTGKIVYQQTNTDNQLQINLTSWAKGMYFITVKGNKWKETHKIVVQ